MPSIAENKRLVQESLSAAPDHASIIASLRDEIDSHNRDRTEAARHDADDRTKSALRFRFKHDKHRSLRDRTRRKHRKHTRRETHESADGGENKAEAAHPFPREPTSPTAEPSDDAFLSSLLDALADDEAASYWESVYSQPIHTFERPSVVVEDGGKERMTDEEYAAWVKQKMWEKNHPEEMYEWDKAKAKKLEEEAIKRKRKEEFVRQRQKDAWTRASRARPSGDDDFVFDFGSTNRDTRDADERTTSQWQHAWAVYLQAWEKLKDVDISTSPADASKLLPWPVLPTKPPTRPHIEEFLRNMPRSDADTKRRLLKLERVRWHPDKIQQRFQNKVSEGTMKVVTGIFQVIDAMWTAEFNSST